MKKFALSVILALTVSLACFGAQQQGQAAPSKQAAPATKGQAPAAPPTLTPEQQAVQAIGAAQRAGDLDALAKATDALVAGFPESPLREAALTITAGGYRDTGATEKAENYYKRVLVVNPHSLMANLALAELITQQTNDRQIDMADKLADAEKYLKTVIEIVSGPNPNPAVGEPAWEEAKKSATAEVHNDRGLIAMLRKSNELAVSEFQQASNSSDEPAYMVRYAHTLQLVGKNDEAIVACDKVLIDPQLPKPIHDLAVTVRANAVKAGGKPAAK